MTDQCSAKHPRTRQRCVFGARHSVGYHSCDAGRWRDDGSMTAAIPTIETPLLDDGPTGDLPGLIVRLRSWAKALRHAGVFAEAACDLNAAANLLEDGRWVHPTPKGDR